ncbi:MAG: carbohydrate kinase family protein [Candidatus Thorarchaeota archaeon]|nr:carbohydrate kinase family protein [Candidatus Thorarchaeota archaeon]
MDWHDLLAILRDPPNLPRPVIMPDFFVDHFVIGGTFDDLIRGLEQLAHQGGGNLIGTRHMIKRGGNSVNTASALLRLGAHPVLVVKTSVQGRLLLQTLVDPALDLSHVHTTGDLSSTVSIETEYQGRRVNLMISDSGSVADFTVDDLSEDDVEAIRQSGLVALLCLNHNNDPAKTAHDVFSLVRQNSEALTFLDIGDPSSRPQILNSLVGTVLRKELVDVLSVNENEAQRIAHVVEGRTGEIVYSTRPGDWLDSAQVIAESTSVQVDLHTPLFAASIQATDKVVVPTFVVTPVVTCGAGDAWNAGDVFGLLLGVTSEDRLILANAVGALYVTNPQALHPSPQDIEKFLRSSPRVNRL